MQKQIDEVMDLVEEYGDRSWTNESGTSSIYRAIESKLRELLPVWQPIETAPQKVAILVKGGLWRGDVSDPSPNSVALVSFDGEQFAELGGDYYSSWIERPTHWKPVDL